MNVIEEIEKWGTDLWDALKPHVGADAEEAAKAVFDAGKQQVTELAQQAEADAKADATTAAQGAATVAADVAAGVGGVTAQGEPVAPAQAPAPPQA